MILLLLCGSLLLQSAPEDPIRQDWPLTRTERTENRETSTLADVENFIEQLIARGAPIRRETLGLSAKGREIPLVICADPMVRSGEEARETGRLVIYLQANIHGGEIEGKEVVQMLLRELAAGEHPTWLARCVFVCTPVYNTDGNEEWGPGLENRAHQNGPAIVGRRPNGQGLDLNRDCMKAGSPEMRAALAGIYRHWDPQVVLDLHTTNGTRHGYSLTYAPPLHPDTDPEVLEFARESLLPEVRERLRKVGEQTNDYGNVQIIDDARGWATFSPLGRYVTNYAGLRGRIGVLSEATSFLPLETRLRSTKRFVEEVIDVCTEQAGSVAAVCRAADARGREGSTEPLTLSATLTPRGEEPVPLERAGEDRAPHESPGVIVEETMPIYDRFAATRSLAPPRAYWIPAAESEVISLLRRHGAEVEPCRWDRVPTMDAFTPASVKRSGRSFQGIRMLSLTGEWAPNPLSLDTARRGYVVSMRQPLARLIFHLLEPESSDGVFAWGMVHSAIVENQRVSIRRVR